MEQVGIREIKNSLSSYLRQVKAGAIITITDRGEPVARLIPVESNPPQGLMRLLDSGLACWKGGKPRGASYAGGKKAEKTLAEMVAEDRR